MKITQELKSILLPNIKVTLFLALSRRTKHMVNKDGQVCFPRRRFANPVNTRRCNTEPVKPLDNTNKDVRGGKLQLMTITVCPVDCACFCPLLKTQHYCLCPSRSFNPPQLPTHPLKHAIRDITVGVKKVAQKPAVLAS